MPLPRLPHPSPGRDRSGRRGDRVARCLVLLLALSLPGIPGGEAAAQEPPDSAAVPDSLAVADSAVVADSLLAQGDSVAPDTIFYNLPELEGAAPEGWARGVWVWDHEAIMASGANTLVELVAEVPGLVPLRGGDYGTPLGLGAFGAFGGALRVMRDGVEVTPLEGSVVDLQGIGLGGIGEVRFERRLNELVVHLTSVRFDDGRPFSLVEAGTGDLDTNIFRGTFANPTALGGSVALALERVDTRGPRGEEPGNRNGVWARYQLHRGDRAGLSLDFRRMSTETDVEEYAASTTRTDWGIRGQARLLPELTGGAYWSTSRYAVDDSRDRYVGVGGARSQLGAHLSWAREGGWARGAYRRFGGEELPGDRLEFEGGLDDPGFGGVSVGWERAGWADEESTSARRISAWTAPFFGFSLFGSRESGTRGARTGPVTEPIPAEPDTTAGEGEGEGEGAAPAPLAALQEEQEDSMAAPLFRIADRTATRYGAQWAWRGVVLSGALLEVEADSLLPTGLDFDRGAPAFAGGTRSGWEAFARLPLPVLDGLHVQGSLQRWDAVKGGGTGWPYLPERIYRGSFVYHKTFLESGNLELDWRLGVRGRGPMSVRRAEEVVLDEETGNPVVDEETGEEILAPPSVPFYQSWYARIQVRVVTVRIFIGWENLAVRRNLQDFPGRVQPATRAFYGIRWTLWN